MAADVDTILDASATAMSDVTSVHFDLRRSGAVVFIDEFESIALDKIKGRFSAPGSADAVLDVTVDGSLHTKLGAVALGGEVWLSNPVTGKFEVLDTGYDIDPATFFDPEHGWGPLMGALTDAVLVGVEDRGGKRYHVRAVGPAAQMEIITAGLVRDQDVAIDFWLRRDTALVTAAEFSTVFSGKTTDWVIELSGYGDDFEIKKPEVDG
ncbi:MAG TPA: LppX_LprAFG lipoprotein [Ilumatobacteraceae bacterium]